jgi:glutathione S-transferase
VQWGNEKAASSLAIFDAHAIGSRPYVCGDELTIADYFAAELISAGALIGESYARYPNVRRWLETMKRLPSWRKVNEVYDGFAASIAGKPFVTLGV